MKPSDLSIFRTTLFHSTVIVLAGLLAYSNTFSAPFNFDDIDSILLNGFVTGDNAAIGDFLLSSRRAIGYLSFMLNYKVGATDVFGYHLVNLAIHLLAAITLYHLVLFTCTSESSKESSAIGDIPRHRTLALFCSLLFVLHPIQTQAVTYIVQRFTSLCALFYLAGILCYALARRTSCHDTVTQHNVRPTTWGWLTASLICAALATRTKEIAFTFPIMVMIYEFLFFSSDKRQRFKYLLLPVITPLFALCVIIIQALNREGILGLRDFTNVKTNMSRIDYLFTQFEVITTYIRLLFFPVNQNIDYDYPISTAFTGKVALSALALGLLLLAAIWLWIRAKRTDSTTDQLYLRLISFGIFWFFVTLSVESSIIPIEDVINEHRLYLPSAGAFISIIAAFMFAADRLNLHSASAVRAMTFTFLMICITFTYVTYQRNAVWASNLTLWADAYAKAPNKARVINNYAATLILRGQGATALPLIITAIEKKPGDVIIWQNLPRIFNQIPALKGRYRSGHEMVDNFGNVQVVMMKEWYSNALNNLGLAYEIQNNPDKAFENYQRALNLTPKRLLIYNNALHLIATMKDRTQAAVYLRQLKPHQSTMSESE